MYLRDKLLQNPDAIFKSNFYGDFKILEYKDCKNVVIEFLESGFVSEVNSTQIVEGRVRDYSIPTICGVGIVGKRKVKKGGKHVREYAVWTSMIKRCYDNKFKISKPTYTDCTVSEHFKHYENFFNWCRSQKGFKNTKWHLDKDLLVKGNKIYSADTCCFIPVEINSALTKANIFRGEYPIGVSKTKYGKYVASLNLGSENGKVHIGNYSTPEDAFMAYKLTKEQYLKELAEKYKEMLDFHVYQALLSYKVEIKD